MKQSLLTLFLLFAAGGVTLAQITLSRESLPSVGDTLYTAVDNLPSNISISPAGPDQRWDFTNLQAPFSRQQVVRSPRDGQGSEGFPNASLLILGLDNLETYYRLSNSGMTLLGAYGVDPLGLGAEVLTRYSPPVSVRRTPLRYRDANQEETNLVLPFSTDDLPRQVLDRFPITPDSLRIRLHIDRSDFVDAWGKITIPGGIYDVLREKRIETRITRLDAKIGFLPWQDITDLIPGNDQLGEVTTVSYHFVSNEAKEPIAIVYLDGREQTVLRVEFKANDVTTNVQNVSNLKPGVYAFPNPAIVNVRFEFSNLPPGEYTLTIYNILGVEQWHETYFINGNLTEKVNVASLRKGTYLYSLTNSRGKTITTKRLVVIKP